MYIIYAVSTKTIVDELESAIAQIFGNLSTARVSQVNPAGLPGTATSHLAFLSSPFLLTSSGMSSIGEEGIRIAIDRGGTFCDLLVAPS